MNYIYSFLNNQCCNSIKRNKMPYSRKIQYPKMLGSREGILDVARTSSKLHLFLQTNKQK